DRQVEDERVILVDEAGVRIVRNLDPLVVELHATAVDLDRSDDPVTRVEPNPTRRLVVPGPIGAAAEVVVFNRSGPVHTAAVANPLPDIELAGAAVRPAGAGGIGRVGRVLVGVVAEEPERRPGAHRAPRILIVVDARREHAVAVPALALAAHA